MMKRFLGMLVVVAFGMAGQLQASWQTKDSVGLPVIVYQGNQWNVHGVPDGRNGSIIVWQDRRDGVADKLMAQHLDASGNFLWGELGNQLSYTSGFQYYPQMLPDGNGGAFVTWEDNRNGADYDIYAQHVSSDGSLLWGGEGKPVCTVAGHQYNPMLAGDGNGGLIISWQDKRSGGWDVYAQHVGADGSLSWGSSGLAVCTISGDQLDPQIAGDGLGGAIVAWTDYRSSATFPDIYAQSIGADGSVHWGANGIAACIEGNTQWRVQISSDGQGGAVLSWLDRRSGATDQLFGQHLGSDGTLQWGAEGLELCTAPGIQYNQRMSPDGAGGAFVVWQDNRKGSDYDIYAQHVAGNGSLLWGGAAKAICTAGGQQYNPDLFFDAGTLVMVWQDKRNGTNFLTYGQSCDQSGAIRWTMDGVVAGRTTADQNIPVAISDGVTGLICAWTDFSSGSGDIYAQRIGGNGVVGGGMYRSLTQEQYADKALKLWTKSKGMLASPNGGNLRDSVFACGMFPNGMTMGVAHPELPKNYAWELFNHSRYIMNALPQTSASRPFDLLKGRKMYGVLRNPSKTRYNNSLVGEAITLKLNIAASDAGMLSPGFGDLIYFDTYGERSVLNRRSLRVISQFIDSALTQWASYPGMNYAALDSILHRVNASCASALDTISSTPLKFTGSRSIFSVPFLAPGPAVTGPAVEFALNSKPALKATGEVGSAFSLLQNYPNPFNPGTQIEFTLDQPAVVSLAVFNVLGQKVATLLDNARLDEGFQTAWFDGTALASGTYFYRLNVTDAASGSVSSSVFRKMNLVK